MRKVIVAIGGGQIRTGGTTRIDREIIHLTGKKQPRLLFIPTASSDADRYWQRVQGHFGARLKCKTDVLFLIKKHPSKQEIRRKVMWAEAIYVGGGNTLLMMRLWRRLGVDKLLKRAYARGLSSPASAPVLSVGLTPATPIRCLSTIRRGGSIST